jgi:hypothetical protein
VLNNDLKLSIRTKAEQTPTACHPEARGTSKSIIKTFTCNSSALNTGIKLHSATNAEQNPTACHPEERGNPKSVIKTFACNSSALNKCKIAATKVHRYSSARLPPNKSWEGK